MRALVVASLAIAVVAPAGADGASSAFPGRNGLVVFASDRTVPREPEIYAAGVDDRVPRNLTTNEESDTRPDASPDGRWIAFDSGMRDGGVGVFLMRPDGTGRRLLVAGESPAWSPDSRRLAFHDNRGRIAVVDVDTGASHPLVEGFLPHWSPDGRLIAFFRGPQLWIVEASGGDPRPLVSGVVASGHVTSAGSWSPDGTRFVFAGGEPDANGFPRSSEILVVQVADASVTRLTQGGGPKSGPSWSPDGTAIAFSEEPAAGGKSELVVVAADGTGRRLLTRNGRLTYDQRPVWSPDGAWVAFSRGASPTAADHVFVVRRDGTGLRRLTHPRSWLPASEGPKWLPGGQTVLFSRASTDTDDDLFVAEPDGRGVRRLTDNVVRDTEPAWSPDGSYVAFVRTLRKGTRGDQNEELYVMRADGTGVRRLTRYPFEDFQPSWSPDGSRIVFARRVDLRSLTAIYVIRPDGTGLRRLTVGPPGFHSGPALSPDGRLLAFTSGNGVGDGGAVYVMDADGSEPRRLVRRSATFLRPRWSPDGRRLAVTAVTSCGRGCSDIGVYVVRRDGTGLRKVAEGGAGVAWSPDGRALVFGAGPIVILDLRSGRTREIVRGDASHQFPDWQPRCTRSGTARRDRLVGSSGDDLLCGLDGDDRLRGGRGRDRLFGGGGHDRIHARDRAFDVVGCGPGRDTVVADRRDLVGEDCEIRA